MEKLSFAQQFGRFLDSNITPYHCVYNISSKLLANGFIHLSERKSWQNENLLNTKGKYFYTRGGSTLVAFVVGGNFKAGNGFKIIGAHTDSPVLKVKPISNRTNQGYIQVGVETYGGGLWHTWLDRDLCIGGRVVVKNKEKKTFEHRLVHIKRPILRVPSLCIHLQSADERAALKLNPEDHLVPMLGQIAAELNNNDNANLDPRHPPSLLRLLGEELSCDAADIVDLDLTLSDTQPSQIGGINSEFVFGPRMDNQMHCYTSTEALIAYSNDSKYEEDEFISMIALFDHEEVGSESVGGAGSPVMRDAVERISSCFSASPNTELYKVGLDKSLLLSADGAHAIHPNYAGKHESKHQPKMNLGTVVKTNANQRYATSGITGFIVREIARQVGAQIQEFVVRQDSPCGSTIGPIISANTGIRTCDIGIPQLSMHSIRETCGVDDLESNFRLLKGFFEIGHIVDESLISQSDL